MPLVISFRALILVSHAMPNSVIKQHCDLARRGGDRLLFADPRREASIERAQGRVTSACRATNKVRIQRQSG